MKSRQSSDHLSADVVMELAIEAVRAMYAGHNPDKAVRKFRKEMANLAAQMENVEPDDVRQEFDKIIDKKESERKMRNENNAKNLDSLKQLFQEEIEAASYVVVKKIEEKHIHVFFHGPQSEKDHNVSSHEFHFLPFCFGWMRKDWNSGGVVNTLDRTGLWECDEDCEKNGHYPMSDWAWKKFYDFAWGYLKHAKSDNRFSTDVRVLFPQEKS